MNLSSLLGVRLTLMIGPVIAVPAPPPVVEALSSVEITQSDQGRDAFELTVTDGHITGHARLKQSDWGMKPYSALFGTLKVVDEVVVEVEIEV